MSRRGMTLIEMMVAMAATLMLMAAIAQVFSVFGTAVSDSRSVIETDARMRAVAWQLRTDLAGATAATLPPLKPAYDSGYFEIIEGPSSDIKLFYDAWKNTIRGTAWIKTGTAAGPDPRSDDRILGDTDDVLLFTTQSTDPPFLGRFESGKYESSVAEVAWFLRPTRSGTAPATSNPTTYTLHRRQMLVVGYVGSGTFATSQNMVDASKLTSTGSTAWQKYMNLYDISARAADTSGVLTFLPNTLSDLTRRESRFMHNVAGITSTTGFPFAFPDAFQKDPALDGLTFAGTTREGEDVVLSNVIAFDVRVFDPTAAVQLNGATVLVPGDPGFASGSSGGTGAYVDLGNGETSVSTSGLAARFATDGDRGSGLVATQPFIPRTWDTWSSHYESDGIDQDGDGVRDQASNGLDDNTDGIVDNGYWDADADGEFTFPSETGELETAPPYPFPLRGIEVRIRCYEPSSRQVRQMTIRHTFVR
jgi:prepilin-type N-terminal cleavage/methylation domain-containing protein